MTSTTAAARPGYGVLLRTPGGPAASAAARVGRMPIAMVGLGCVLLLVDRRGSYAVAGAVAAAFSGGRAVLGPYVARLVDVHGQARALPPALAVHSVALLAVVLLAGPGTPAAVLLAAAVVAGGALPPLGSCVRVRWSDLLTARGRDDAEALQDKALALESVLDEVVFVLGPVLVVASAAADPAFGIYAAVALGAAGTLAFAAQRVPESAHPVQDHGSRSALRLRGMPVLTLSLVAVGQTFGALEVVMVAFAEERGAPGSAGWLLALVALGSGVAGLAYGARRWRTPVARRYLLALAGLAVGVAPLLLAGGLAAMVPAALLAGVAISPTLIASFGIVQQLVPPAARTEGYSLLTSGLLLGVAAGSALGGVLTDAAGSRTGFAACTASAVLALAVAAAGRRTWSERSPAA